MSGAFQVGAFQPAYQQDAVATEVTGGGWIFDNHYELEIQRRRRAAKRRREREEEAEQIAEPTTREIAQLLRRQEAEDEKRAELLRLREIASTLKAKEARAEYGERVAKALERAIAQGNYSALEALDRELRRAKEEEEFMRLAVQIILRDLDS